jgi:hypothetical protein
MAEVGLGLGYWLAETQFTVTLAKRDTLERGRLGSYPRPVVDIEISPSAIADLSSRQNLTIDSAQLEQVSLTINLDDRGIIESLDSEAGRGASPVINLVGQAVNDEAAVAVTVVLPADPDACLRSLEGEWIRANEDLAVQASRLEANIDRLLGELGQASATSTSILHSGQALELLQMQLGTITQIKRTWVADQALEVESGVWDLTTSDLLWFPNTELPTDLVDKHIPEPLVEMAERFGVLIAIADRDRPETDQPLQQDLHDTLVLRRSRSAIVGAYVRDAGGDWRLADGSVLVMEVVDIFSETDYVPLDGSWLRSRSFELAYHPDMSLKTFGLATVAQGSNVRRSRASGTDRGDSKPLVQPRTPSDQQESTKAQV